MLAHTPGGTCMKLAHIYGTIAVIAMISTTPALIADSAKQDAENGTSTQGTAKRSNITGGTYSWGADGNLHMDVAFDGETIAFDPATGTAMVVKSGMTKSEFKALAKEKNVPVKMLSNDEYQVGMEIFVFESGKLTRSRK